MVDNSGSLHNSDIRQIAELMQALERSGFDSLQIETADIKLALSKGDSRPMERSAPAAASAASAPAASSAPAVRPASPAAATPAAAAQAGGEDLFVVRSPIMGQFYRAPDPTSQPFVAVGTQVDASTTVGLIEVMKVFNAVTAGTKGTIVEICVEDSQTIEMGQALFKIRPAA